MSSLLSWTLVPFQKLGRGMFLTRPLGEFVRKRYVPGAVVTLREAHGMFLEESVEEGLLETPSFQGALFAEPE